MSWKKEKFGLFKSKADLGEQKRRNNRRFFVFQIKANGTRGMMMGWVYAADDYFAQLYADTFFSFMGKSVQVSRTME